MSRHRFLVTYDITESKRLKAVFKSLRDFGEHVQYSVFLCELNGREFLQMEERLRKIIHHRTDQVIIVNLGPATDQRMDLIQTIGKDFEPTPKVFIA